MPSYRQPLDSFFGGLCAGSSPCISVIGCGGKTTLARHLELYFAKRERGVLAGTSVHAPQLRDSRTGEVFLFSNEAIAGLAPRYSAVVLEADGSRGLPLKGWANYEPVIPPQTTLTVGVLPLPALGLPATEAHVHRLPLFLEQSGARAGCPVDPRHLARLISHPHGLFAKARGARLLFFNQAECGPLPEAAAIAALLPPEFRATLKAVVAGSIHENWLVEI